MGRSVVSFDEVGTVASVVPDDRPGDSYLEHAGSVDIRVAGRRVDWSEPELGVDADEVEIVHRHPLLSATVRHSFGARWDVRLALANLSPERLRLDEVTLGWEPTYDWPVWALAAGAVGSYAIAAPDGQGPLLGGVLGLGTLEVVTPTGLGLGRVVLEAGGRYVAAWQWGWFRDPRAFAGRPGGQRGDRQVPRSLHLTAGEATLICAGDDEALLLPPQVMAEPVRDQVELVAYEPGRYRVDLRSARGVTHYDLCWSEPVEQLLTGVAVEILAGRRTPAGIVRLPGVEAALVVQFALRIGLDDAEAAEEALDLFTARLDAPSQLDPRTAGFLCGEFDRTGDEETLEAATRIILDVVSPVPGLGLSAAQLGLARVLTHRPTEVLADHLATIGADLPVPGTGSVAEQTAALELAMLAPGSGPSGDVTERLLALGARLGGGLKGHPVRPLPVHETAHLAAVLAALDETTSTGMRTRWACTAHELGRWSEAAVTSRLEQIDAPAGQAHGWLAVAARTR